MRLRFVVIFGFLAATCAAQAQVGAAGPSAVAQPTSGKADSKADAAQSAAAALAMERAQRQAANPMRAILEAAKIQRRPADGANVSAQPVRRATASPAAPRVAPVLAIATATRAPDLALALPAAALSPPAPATAAVSPLVLPAEPTAAGPSIAKPELPATVAAAIAPPPHGVPPVVPTIVPQGVPQTTPSLAPQVASPALEARLENTIQPKLLNMVEPNITPRLWDELPRGAVLEVDLSLRADGSVASVAFASLAPRALLRAVQSAAEQWVFEPLLAPRVHRVQLVLNAPPR